jgi:endonuclease YncB( thermonuclease family)
MQTPPRRLHLQNRNRNSLFPDIITTALLPFLALCLSSFVAAADLVGQATIIDGDTIEMRGQRIRLWGIDAPESDQLCRGEDSLHYRCGNKAANDLHLFVARRPVVCVPITVDRYGRAVASCEVGGVDLSEWLVRNGLALDWPQYSHGKFRAAQNEAEQVERGMWVGSFTEPWKYRSCIRAGGASPKCSDGN